MKIKLLLLFSALFLLTACSKDDEPTTLSSEASITSLTCNKRVVTVGEDGKEQETEPAFGVSFTVTEPETEDDFGIIQNTDSLPYKTVVNQLRPIPLPSNVRVSYKISEQDEYVALTDKTYLDFSAQTPVYLQSVSPDGEHSAKYLLKVKVHQVDPDSVIWRSSTPNLGNGAVSFAKAMELDGKLYYFVTQNGITSVFISPDGEAWTELATSLSSSYLTDVVLYNKVWYGLDAAGGLIYSDNAVLWQSAGVSLDRLLFALGGKLLATSGGKVVSVNKHTDDFTITNVGVLPAGFPTEKFQTLTVFERADYEIGYVTGGSAASNHLLYTIDGGETWGDYAVGTGSTPFEARTGASLVSYDNQLWIVGGEEALPVKTSSNKGLTWTTTEKYQPQPDSFALRNQTAVAFKGSIFIVGETGGILTVWKGRMNKKDFLIQ